MACHFGVLHFHFDMVGIVRQRPGMAAGKASGLRHLFWLYRGKSSIMLTAVYFLIGLVCFALFFKSIDFFEKM